MRKNIDFQKEGKNGDVAASNNSKVEDKRRGELWMVSANLESRLVFPIAKTTLRPDLVVSSTEKTRAILLELTVLWE